MPKSLPLPGWIRDYHRPDLVGDLMAGTITAIMLVPQAMAYASLAGLPPQVGLYASTAPLVLYALLGSSRTLAVGPVALVSLLVATGISPLAPEGGAEYVGLALALALLVGLIQLAMGLVRLGALVSLLGHPVVSGFTSAAALVIGFGQLRHLLGIPVPRRDRLHELILDAARHAGEANPVTLAIGVASVATLLFFGGPLRRRLARLGMREALVVPLTRGAPLLVVLAGTLVVGLFGLDHRAGVAIVGAIPAGLPPLSRPPMDPATLRALLPIALVIGFVGFAESFAVAKSLASRRRQRIDANRELVGLGAANLASALTGGYPVTGGFSRSVVNFAAGANTPLASVVTAGLVLVTVALLTPLFHYLPRAVLASIIMVAVFGLVDTRTPRRLWRYSKSDAASLAVTFVAVLAAGIETGIAVGIVVALVLHLWRTSQPHMAVVGRVGDSEHYRNVERHAVTTCPEVAAVRVDESLYFANTRQLEGRLLRFVADRPRIEHLVLICSAVNFIDGSALETLETMDEELSAAGVTLHVAEVKGPVMDRLRRVDFVERLGPERVHLSTHAAMVALGCAETGSAATTEAR